MVRTRINHSVEDTNDTAKKRTSTNGKAQQQIAGVWICKIDNCNKKFAREADLKRHRNTAKAHRTDEQLILCPQCDSTFTRTDALRRHQRSRHNRIYIDPADSSNKNIEESGDEGESTSVPQSRSHSPRRGRTKTKNSPIISASTSVPVPTIFTQPDAPGRPTDSQSYYRNDMVNAVFVPPHTPNGVLSTSNSQQPQATLPGTGHDSLFGSPWPLDKRFPIQPLSGTIPYSQSATLSAYFPGNYHRTFSGQTTLVPRRSPPGSVNMFVNSNIFPPQLNGNKKQGNAAQPPSKPPPDVNNNIDPTLQNNAPVISKRKTQEEPEPSRSQEMDTFADSGLSRDVQKVLKAVLAIDPGIIGDNSASAIHPSNPQMSSEDVESLQKALTSNATSLQHAAGLGASSKPDTCGNDPLQEKPQDAQAVSESLTLPDGIKDLINEDSLSYASPS